MTPEPVQSARHERMRRYGLALLLAALAGSLQWAIEPLTGGHVPFLFFVPAIIVTAVYAGPWPAVLVGALGAIQGGLVLRQGGELMLQTHPAAWAALAYGVLFCGLVWLGRRLYSSNRRATAAERRLRTAEDDAAVGLFEIDIANDTLFASSGFWQLTGREPLAGPVPLSAWLRVLHPDDVTEARELMARPPEELRTEIEHRVLLPDGGVRWVMTRMRGEAAEGGEHNLTRYIRGVMVDITHRKQAAEALADVRRELEQRVADLSEVHELTGRLETCEDLTEQLTLILTTLARLHGAAKGVVSLLQPDGAHLKLAANIGLSKIALARMAVVPVGVGACGLVCRDQQRVYVEDVETDERFARSRDFARTEGFRAVHGTPLFDHAGNLLGAITIHMPQPKPLADRELRVADICSRKAAVLIERARAEQLAREHDRRFRSVLDASAAGFIVLRPVREEGGLIRDFVWVYVNSAAAGSWQRTPEQLMGRTVNESMPGAWDRGEVFDNFVAVARDRQLREFEHLSHMTPRREWWHVIASPLDGDVAVWFTNVTARRNNEQALMEADQRKDEFLATLAHELRNPLAPIRQATQIAMAPRASEPQKRWSYAVIERQVQHMSLLLDDLLDISRITRGQLRLRRQSCELHEVFGAAIEPARPLIDKKGHQLEVDLPDELVWMDADPLRLSQVLSNLLTNAAKYTNPGGRIRAAARQEGRLLVIEVSDNGIGLEASELAGVFNMFSQVTAAQERSEGGLGIGLALTRGLVQLHGGSIEAQSDGPGRGATFTVRMPVVRSSAAASEAAAERAPVVQAGSVRRRLLIADDNRDAAESLAMLMRLEGHEVRLAHDGRAALAILEEFDPDAALLDIGMPGLSGYELARQMRADPRHAGTLLIAITGWGQAVDKARALSEGFDVHMTKPVEVSRVVELLRDPDPVRASPGVIERLPLQESIYQ